MERRGESASVFGKCSVTTGYPSAVTYDANIHTRINKGCGPMNTYLKPTEHNGNSL